jgi:NitT/TauT family transport system substrate-binding protein
VRRRDVLVGIWAAWALPRAASAQTAPHIRVGSSTTGESFMEGTYAEDGGFLRKAGLDAEVSAFVNGGLATAAVIGGSVDVAISNTGSIAAAHIRGLPIVLIAPSAMNVPTPRPTTALAVVNDSPISAARDLAGKTVGLSTMRDLQQAAVMAWVDKNGGDGKAVNFVEVPNAQQDAALTSKRIDAALLVEPFISAARSDVRVVGVPYEALAPRLLTTAWIANANWLEANAPTAQRFTAAIHATALWANGNRNVTAVLLAKYTKLPPEIVATMGRATYGETLDPALIQPVLDASSRYGFLPRRFAAAELFTGSKVSH